MGLRPSGKKPGSINQGLLTPHGKGKITIVQANQAITGCVGLPAIPALTFIFYKMHFILGCFFADMTLFLHQFIGRHKPFATSVMTCRSRRYRQSLRNPAELSRTQQINTYRRKQPTATLTKVTNYSDFALLITTIVFSVNQRLHLYQLTGKIAKR
jgi:hypothetical protein